MANKYNKPWKVEYETHDWRGNPLPMPYEVLGVVDSNGKRIIETDSGIYGPDAETAEYLVKSVNERKDE